MIRLFVLDKITGFVSNDTPIVIRDSKGKVFYKYQNVKKGPVFFNLPPGRYQTSSEIKQTPEPRKYDLPPLADFERRLKIPGKIKIVQKKNPNKCTVFLEKGLIVIDPDFLKTLSKQELKYIICHELGHYYYGGHNPNTEPEKYQRSEAYCDRFADRMMLKGGYNPNQLVRANYNSLSSGSNNRKKESYHFNCSVK